MLGSCSARHPHLSRVLLLPVVSMEGPFLQDGFQVVPEATLRAVVTVGGQFGNLEGRIGLSVTAPLNRLEFAADAVHGIVPARRLRCAIVHAADGEGVTLVSWLEERLKSSVAAPGVASW